MCGISGYSLPFKPDPSAVKILMLDNKKRGEHATGFVTTRGEIIKAAESVDEFIKSYHEELGDHQLITHTRHATMGRRTDDALAHPFEYGNIVGAHNGWLIDNSKRDEIEVVCETFGYDPSDFPVDSMLIFHHMNELNDEVNAISSIEGAMALSWFDRSCKVKEIPLCLYRRSSKPLYIGIVEKRGRRGIYYSSRSEGLNLIGINDDSIEIMPSDTIFKYLNGNLVDTLDVPDPQIEIKEDEKPSAFDWRFKSHTALYSDYYTIEDKKSPETKKEEHSKRRKDLPVYSLGSASPYGDLSPYSKMDAVGNFKGIADQLIKLGYYSVEASMTNTIRTKIDSSRASIICELIEINSKKPLSGWQVMIDGHPETLTVTKDNGITGLFVPDNKIGKKIRLSIFPPVDYRKENNGEKKYPKFFFQAGNKDFSIDKGRVLEVTLRVPFRETEEEAVKNSRFFSLAGFKDKQLESKNIIDNPEHFTEPTYGNYDVRRRREFYDAHENFETNNGSEHSRTASQNNFSEQSTEPDIAKKLEDLEEAHSLAHQFPDRRSIDPDINPSFFSSEKDFSEMKESFQILLQTVEKGMELSSINNEREINSIYSDVQNFIMNQIVKNYSRVFRIKEIESWTYTFFKKQMDIEEDNKYDVHCKAWAMEQISYDVEEILKIIDENISALQMDNIDE